mmetsp:Transcript_5624/g.23036  ORF Transcript_5624/g.23036 Transcript_5624/m.23036 type:complete len:324 (+) Transcript_5624:4430-5401(+)
MIPLQRHTDVKHEVLEEAVTIPQTVRRELPEVVGVHCDLEVPLALMLGEVTRLVHHEWLPVTLPDGHANDHRKLLLPIRHHAHHLRAVPHRRGVRRHVHAVFIVRPRPEMARHQTNLRRHLVNIPAAALQLSASLLRHPRHHDDVLSGTVRTALFLLAPQRIRRGIVRQHEIRDVHRRTPVDDLTDVAAEDQLAKVQLLLVAPKRQDVDDVVQGLLGRELLPIFLVLLAAQSKPLAKWVSAPTQCIAVSGFLEGDVQAGDEAPADALCGCLPDLQLDPVLLKDRSNLLRARRVSPRGVERRHRVLRIVPLVVGVPHGQPRCAS